MNSVLKLVLVAFFWAGTFIAGRLVAGEVSPASAGFFRFLVASIFLNTIASYKSSLFVDVSKKALISLFILGLGGLVAYNLFFFAGLQHIEASRASMIVALNPIGIALASAFFFRDALSPKQLLGISLSVFGAVFVISRGDLYSVFSHGFGRGELLIFGCVVSWVLYSVLSKSLTTSFAPFNSVRITHTIAALGFFPIFLYFGGHKEMLSYSLENIASLIFLGVFGSAIGVLWYVEAIEKLGATYAGLCISLVPVFATLQGYLILGESIDENFVTGAFLILLGIQLTRKKGRYGFSYAWIVSMLKLKKRS